MRNWKDIVKTSDRYKDFVILDIPVMFKDMFAGRNISCVQVHSTDVFGEDGKENIIGFCGAFKWEGDKLTSLDHDSYNKEVMVLGYSWFKNNTCLDILVGDDW